MKTSRRYPRRDTANSPMAASSSILHRRFQAWLAGSPEDDILRWMFRAIVAVTIAALAGDLATMSGWLPATDPLPPGATRRDAPEFNIPVPSILAPLLPGGDK